MKRAFNRICYSVLLVTLIIGLTGASYQNSQIVRVNSSTTEVYIGSNFELPKKIKVKYSDGTTFFVPVKWSNERPNTQKAGIFVCKGTVKGYEQSAIHIYHVIPYLATNKEYSTGQLTAMNNCLMYIKKNFLPAMKPINKHAVNIIDASLLKVMDYRAIENKQYKVKAMNSADWIITIGSTRDHDFFVLVCDSENYEVLGFMPIA